MFFRSTDRSCRLRRIAARPFLDDFPGSLSGTAKSLFLYRCATVIRGFFRCLTTISARVIALDI